MIMISVKESNIIKTSKNETCARVTEGYGNTMENTLNPCRFACIIADDSSATVYGEKIAGNSESRTDATLRVQPLRLAPFRGPCGRSDSYEAAMEDGDCGDSMDEADYDEDLDGINLTDMVRRLSLLSVYF